MKATIEATLEGKVVLDIKAEVETFADLAKLSKKMADSVAGIKKVLPDFATKKVEKLRFVTE